MNSVKLKVAASQKMKVEAFIYKTTQDQRKPSSIEKDKKFAAVIGRSSYKMNAKSSMFDNGKSDDKKRSKSKGTQN